jgi:hypothetical protein
MTGGKSVRRCRKKGRNETHVPDAIKGWGLRSMTTSLGRKITIASPVAKKIHDVTVLLKVLDKRRYIPCKECLV